MTNFIARPVLISDENLVALEQGLTGVNITSLQLVRAVDGNYELHVGGLGANPLPLHGARPLVPVEDER